ncbi:hypothetical protein ABPG72_015832 [Tetrahymena utriculariae]
MMINHFRNFRHLLLKNVSQYHKTLQCFKAQTFYTSQQFYFSVNNDNNKDKILEINKVENAQSTQQQPKKKERIKPVIEEQDLEWKFVKGSGPGGQSVNKTSNNAVLIHKPSGIQVRSHASRQLEKNKQYCLKQLSEKLDVLINGENSKKLQKEEKKKKQQDRRKRKSAEKYGNKEKNDGQIISEDNPSTQN